MSNTLDTTVSRLASQSDAVGRLAQDTGGFAAAVAAFASQDSQAFRWVLNRQELLPYCELICEWVRIKLCVLRCVEVCGPIGDKIDVPSLAEFAQAVVRLTSNETALRRVVDAVNCGDGADYAAVLEELQLVPFCRLICAWVCSTGYDRICEVICSPTRVPVTDVASTLRAAGRQVASLLDNRAALDVVSKTAVRLNCENLKAGLLASGFDSGCEIICSLICTWRRVWVCHSLCTRPVPILSGVYAVEEAQSFALAAKQLAGQPRALGDLVTAVENGDAKSYAAIVDRFNLGPYCWQVCAWVVSVTCHEFCRCVCVPPGEITPLFTNVGCYLVGPPVSDFNPNGTTKSGALAFTGTIPLIGLIPDGTAPDALKYRFTYQDYSDVTPNPNPIVPITSVMVPPTIIGKLEFQYWDGTMWQVGSTPFWVNNSSASVSIPQNGGPDLVVSVNVDQDAQGWIDVPRFNSNAQGANGLFTAVAAQGLILLDTTKLTSESFDLTGGTAPLPDLTAGETVPVAALSKKPVFQINFEAETVATSTPVNSNSLRAIALSNTSYSYFQHPEWPGPASTAPVTTSPLVLSVDILQLDESGGCAKLDDVIDVLYTAYHPYLGTCRVFVQGPGVASMTTPPGGSISFTLQPNQGVVIGTGNGSTTAFSGTLATPVLPGSVAIGPAAVMGKDNGLGTISGAGLSGTINYGTGAISVTFTTAPASGAQVLVDYDTNVASGTAGTPFDMTGLEPCAYIIWLQATLNLTDGCGQIYGTLSDYIPFCTVTPAN
jgi:hypothetical protein